MAFPKKGSGDSCAPGFLLYHSPGLISDSQSNRMLGGYMYILGDRVFQTWMGFNRSPTARTPRLWGLALFLQSKELGKGLIASSAKRILV